MTKRLLCALLALMLAMSVMPALSENARRLYDGEGYVSFQNGSFTDIRITDEMSALEAILDIQELIGLSNDIAPYSTESGPVSGYTYYTFVETTDMYKDGEFIPMLFHNSLIRVIADSEGNGVGFTADLTHEMRGILSDDGMRSAGEAENLVKAAYGRGLKIHSDKTQLIYWDDADLSWFYSDGKVFPVYTVFTDSVQKGKYDVYLVYPLETSYPIADKFTVSSLDCFDPGSGDMYSSMEFFYGMENAGVYTYTLDMSWAKEVNSAYRAEDTLTVSVPVMYSPGENLYYLADLDNMIAAGNWWNLYNEGEMNPVVTETPEVLDSWHFKTHGTKYKCDVNYVMASYRNMLDVFEAFNAEYGYTSVNRSPLPIMVAMYLTYEDKYPSSADGFEENAVCLGMSHDWEVFGTSPTYTGCVEFGTLAHEFTHGIQSMLTETSYRNDGGALEEGLADVVGEMLAWIYGMKGEEHKWTVGSDVAELIRSFNDPYSYLCPKYIDGCYYARPADESLDYYLDYGGVHTNSGVVNYLAYMMTQGKNGLTEKETVDLWLETLYLTHYNSGFDDLAAYIAFAAEAIGLPENKREYVCALAENMGFTADRSGLENYLTSERGYTYTVNVTYESEEARKHLALGGLLEDDSACDEINMGGADENGVIRVKIPRRRRMWVLLTVGDRKINDVCAALELPDYMYGNDSVDVSVALESVKLLRSLKFDNYGGQLVCWSETDKDGYLIYDDDGYEWFMPDEGVNSLLVSHKGTYTCLVENEDGGLRVIHFDVK